MTTNVAPPPECAPPNAASSDALNPYTRIIAKMGKQHRLLSVHWELTYRCNETCTHCYLDVFKPNAHVAGELTTEQVKQIIDQIAELGALNISFSGGEILVRRDFFEIAEYARCKRFAVRLMTNGILVTPRIADRIAALRPTGVEMSVYGADAETHDAITQRRRSWELTIRAFRLLRERGIHTVMKTPLMHENVHQLHALRELARDLGASFRYDPTITAKDSGDLSPLRHRLTYDDLVWLLREELTEGGDIPQPIGQEHRTCSIGLFSIIIDPYGNVFPCVQVRSSAGNLLVQPLKEIWESALLHDMARLSFDVLPICKTCELNLLCHRCHANALSETGDMRAPATANCREALARRQVMIEKGILLPDFPIPAHLQNGVPEQLEPVPISANAQHSTFIPLHTVLTTRAARADVLSCAA